MIPWRSLMLYSITLYLHQMPYLLIKIPLCNFCRWKNTTGVMVLRWAMLIRYSKVHRRISWRGDLHKQWTLDLLCKWPNVPLENVLETCIVKWLYLLGWNKTWESIKNNCFFILHLLNPKGELLTVPFLCPYNLSSSINPCLGTQVFQNEHGTCTKDFTYFSHKKEQTCRMASFVFC